MHFITLALFMALPAQASTQLESLLPGLEKNSPAAIDALLKLAPEAADELSQVAADSKASLVLRGWAIVGLSRMPSAKEQVLRRLLSSKEPQVIRHLAAAALIERAQDIDTLRRRHRLTRRFSTTKRSFRKRMESMARSITTPGQAERLIALAQNTAPKSPLQLQPKPLAQVMLTAKNNRLRRLAASYLGGVGQRVGADRLLTEVLPLYAFNPAKKAPPWTRGPLYLPAVSMSKAQATAMVEHLLSWLLFCSQHDCKPKPIFNNLRTPELLKAAEIKAPKRDKLATWLGAFSAAAGRNAVSRLIKAQKDQGNLAHLLKETK